FRTEPAQAAGSRTNRGALPQTLPRQGFFMPGPSGSPLISHTRLAPLASSPCRLIASYNAWLASTYLRTLDNMQERYSPTDVEKASHDNWQARDAYRVIEHAKAADGSSKPKFYAC